jgi:hypothetical protein
MNLLIGVMKRRQGIESLSQMAMVQSECIPHLLWKKGSQHVTKTTRKEDWKMKIVDDSMAERALELRK